MYSGVRSADMALDLQSELPDRRPHPGGLAGQGHPHEGTALAVVAPEEVVPGQDVDVPGQQGLLELPGIDAQPRDVQPGDADADPRRAEVDRGALERPRQL